MPTRPSDKHIAIVGAGPGGLTAGMILAHRGFKVSIYEKASSVGGRNAEIVRNGYRFDVGPTFLMMKFLLDEMFEETGRKSSDYLDFHQLDPMYDLVFEDKVFRPSPDPASMRQEIARLFPGEERGFDRFLAREAERFRYLYPCLQKDYNRKRAFLRPELMRAVPHLDVGRSLYDVLARYFQSEELRLSFTFQSKYLGMSPWSCPALFTIIPFIEYGFGIWHTTGGLSEISRAMAKVIEEEGGTIHLDTEVERVLVQGRRATGLRLADGTEIAADDVVINADFAHAMTTLFEDGVLKRYTPSKLRARDYSCSTFMLYLGVDKVYPEQAFHSIVFAKDYQRNLREIADEMVPSDDASFYVRNASVLDPTLAPEGHSAIYVLVPTPNQKSGIDWSTYGLKLREQILDAMEARTHLTDIREHITEEVMLTPDDWQARDVFLGATFNLSHELKQMLYLRPHNAFEELDGVYLVGGGTHPGSGLPTIYESGQISANLLSKKHGLAYREPVPLAVHEQRMARERD